MTDILRLGFSLTTKSGGVCGDIALEVSTSTLEYTDCSVNTPTALNCRFRVSNEHDLFLN